MDKQAKKLFDEFLAIYNRIDALLRRQLKQDAFVDHASLLRLAEQKDPQLRYYSDELKAYARLRNILVHTPVSKASEVVAIPSQETVERYQYIYNFLAKPPLALQLAIPGPQIYSAKLHSKIVDVIDVMAKNVFTHVPVIKDGVMIGVFSENTLLSYLQDKQEIIITADMKIEDIKDYLGFDRHTSEVFIFLPRTTLLKDVYKEFGKAVKNQIRIGSIFITQNGKPTERVLGLITPWDIIDTGRLV